jgi:hypothetical protein
VRQASSACVGQRAHGDRQQHGSARERLRIGSYGIANLLAQVRPNVMMGGEFQWGRRANSSDGFAVNDFRLQFSFKYSYDHKWGEGNAASASHRCCVLLPAERLLPPSRLGVRHGEMKLRWTEIVRRIFYGG